VALAVLLLGLLVLAFRAQMKEDATFKAKNKEISDEYAKEMALYTQAISAWRSLFYCHKHDVVFVPGSKDYAPSEQTWQACLAWSGKKAT